jgi:xanthine dehydrogenase accessory factor
LKTIVIDPRERELTGLPNGVLTQVTPMPEAIVKDMPSGSAAIILTHEHTLDFLVAAEALKRNDLAYVGMIGSATKRATFKNWLKREYDDTLAETRLTLPIGGTAVYDKRPEVIAALTAVEVLEALSQYDKRKREEL